MKVLRLLLVLLLFAAVSASAADRPTMTFSDTVWPEGDGETEGYITVRLSEPYSEDIPLVFRLYQPIDTNAWWASLRIGCSTPCKLAAGETEARVPLHITGNESYQSIAREWQAALFSGSAYDGMLVNISLTEDDPVPVVTLDDVTVTEGSNSDVYWVAVTLTTSSPATGSVAWRTIAETAEEGPDYWPGTFHFLDMQQPIRFRNTSTVTVGFGIHGDTLHEENETFLFELYDPSDLELGRTQIRVTILDDDPSDPPPPPPPPPSPSIVFNPSALSLFAGESATVEATMANSSTAGESAMVSLHATNAAVFVSPTVEVPGTLTVTAMSPGTTEVQCDGEEGRCANVAVEVLAPLLAGLSPGRAATAGGTEVTLRGAGLSNGCSIAFGGVPATSKRLVNQQTIVALAPPHAPGLVSVTVKCGAVTLVLPNAVDYGGPARQRSVRH